MSQKLIFTMLSDKVLYSDKAYTRAAGFNGAMIAEKRSDRIIVVVFGGKSTKTRNTQMIKLAELGFGKLQQ